MVASILQCCVQEFKKYSIGEIKKGILDTCAIATSVDAPEGMKLVVLLDRMGESASGGRNAFRGVDAVFVDETETRQNGRYFMKQ